MTRKAPTFPMTEFDEHSIPDADAGFLRTVASRLRQAFPGQISAIRLFGSKARGDYTQHSDTDLLVLTYEDDHALFRRISLEVYDVALDFGVVATAKVFCQEQFDMGVRRGNAFVKNVLSEGVEL